LISLDLLEAFDGVAAKIALIATYEFDPLFFERRLLRRKGFASAERIFVMMDAGRYQELINQELPVSGFNRHYLVAPINRAPFVFHPKMYLLLDEQRVVGCVGSSNCTNTGIAHNMELCTVISVGSSEKADPIRLSALRQIYHALKDFAADVPALKDTLQKQFFRTIEDLHPWLGQNIVELQPKRLSLEMLHSHREPLWPRILRHLEKEFVPKIAVISPYYDGDLGFLKVIKGRWPNAPLSVIAQQRYATLDGKKLVRLFTKKDRLLAVIPPAGRRLHAKALVFETRKGTYWLAGSANATLAAMKGHNTESTLWFSTEETVNEILMDGCADG